MKSLWNIAYFLHLVSYLISAEHHRPINQDANAKDALFGMSSTELKRRAESPKILIFVPGFPLNDSFARTNLQNNMAVIHRTRNFPVFCLVSTDDENLDRHTAQLWMPDCEFYLSQGSGYSEHIKHANPTLLRLAGFSHVMLLLDDVSLDASFK